MVEQGHKEHITTTNIKLPSNNGSSSLASTVQRDKWIEEHYYIHNVIYILKSILEQSVNQISSNM